MEFEFLVSLHTDCSCSLCTRTVTNNEGSEALIVEDINKISKVTHELNWCNILQQLQTYGKTVGL